MKFEVISWCKFDRFFRWWGQAVHKNQRFFFLRKQFCCSVVGGYQQVQAHLWSRASTFYALPVPLPRQVFIVVQTGVWKWGRKKCWKSGSKGSPNGPQKLLKIDKSVFWRVSKRDLKNGPSPGSGKVRFCHYLLHFSKVGGLKKDTFLGTMLGPFGRQNRWKQGSRTASKKVLKIDTHFTRFGVHFGDHFWVKSRSFAGRRWVWHVDP